MSTFYLIAIKIFSNIDLLLPKQLELSLTHFIEFKKRKLNDGNDLEVIDQNGEENKQQNWLIEKYASSLNQLKKI